MWCKYYKNAKVALFLCISAIASMAADYSVNATFNAGEVYAIVYNGNKVSKRCSAASSKNINFSTSHIENRSITFFSDENCRSEITSISGTELFKDNFSVSIQLSENGEWSYAEDSSEPTDPFVPSDTPKKSRKVVSFLTPWSNTTAVMYLNGTETAMKALNKYCGWFVAQINAPDSGFNVYFKQTIGQNYVGAEGLTKEEILIANEINLDSVAAISDTIWVKANKEGAPEIYSQHPAGVLGDCPTKILPVMMFDWLHGAGSDRENAKETGVSQDFGTGGCSGRTYNMVEKQIGENGVPVRAKDFPTKCSLTEHLDYWFLPEVIATDDYGNEYTNATCRDLELNLTDDGMWLGQKNNQSPEGGLFFLDDFEYLDSAKTVKNKYFDWLSGRNGKHNFGFTMKIQAQFEYVPGQYFEFSGDDDVWVFINNKLVVDIGGQHAEEHGAVDLDTLGLIPDSTYNFMIFYVERHTSESNFKMRTSIDLKTEASIILKNLFTGNPDIIHREVWQKIRKNKLACDFSEDGLDISTERGSATFTLFGGNLPSTGVAMDTAGIWFGGINIGKNFDEFSVNKADIIGMRALNPGSYYVRTALKSDNSQYKDMYFVIGAYAQPTLTYADSSGRFLGGNILSDTLPLNMNPNATMWVGQSYKVYVQFAEEWATENATVYPATDDDALIPCDSMGNPITELQLDSGKASFYIKAIGETWGASLYVKSSSASNVASWKGINIAVPPVPQIEVAYIFDRDGDGRSDSVYVKFDDKLGVKNTLDSAKITFGTTFNETYNIVYQDGSTEAYIVANGSGFSSSIFTGGTDKTYSGKLNVWFTYIDNGKSSIFPAEGLLIDKVGPVITAAEISYMSDGNAQLTLSFSEGLQESQGAYDLFKFHCVRDGVTDSLVKDFSDKAIVSANQWKLIFPKGSASDIVPIVGDSVRFVPPSQNGQILDLANIYPHEFNPWVRITGEQKVTITSPKIVTLSSELESFDSAKVIIQSKEASVPKLVTSEQTLSAEQVAAIYGTQGHYLGDLDMAELVENEIADIVKAIQSTPSYTNSKNKDDTQSYTIEEIIAAVGSGSISINEAKKRYGISNVIVDAYKNGVLTPQNIDKFSRGTESDIKQIVDAIAQNTELRYKATYYSSLGEFVNSNSKVITCAGDVFSKNGQGSCLDNNGKLFLAWNMRAKDGRLVATGVYIARLEYRVKVGSKVVVDRTQDFLWGVRRGKANALELGL